MSCEEYVIPFKDDEAKDKFRKWMGKNRGVSILHADWVYTGTGHEAYKVKITNPKTILLLLLTFPEAMTTEQADENRVAQWSFGPIV